MNEFVCVCLGIFGMWVILGGLFVWFTKTSSYVVEDILECIIPLPWVVVAVLYVIVATPFICIWKFFRNAIRGVSVECWDRAKINHYWKIGCFRLCYDPKARAISNKLFLVRIVNPASYIVHTPQIQYYDEPSVPDGEFR